MIQTGRAAARKTTSTAGSRNPVTPAPLAAKAPVLAARKRPYARALWIIALGTAVLLATFVVRHGDGAPKNVESAPHESSSVPFQSFVAAPGRVEAVSGVRNLSFDVPGKIRKVFVEQGQTVTAGQLIAELENDNALARRDSARASVAEAQAHYTILERELQSNIVRAEQDVARLTAELALVVEGPRLEQIDAARAEAASLEAEAKRAAEEEHRYYDPTGTYESWARQLYDQAHRRAEAAKGNLDAANSRLREFQTGSRPAEIDRARALLKASEADLDRQRSTREFQLAAARAQSAKAKADLDNQEAELNRTRLVSPLSGVVVWKFVHGGEVIDAIQQQPVASVADLSHLRVSAWVDEADYAKLAPGQSVKISADAFANSYFSGRVEKIGSTAGEKPFTTGQAKERLDVRVIEAAICLPENSPLKLGLRVTAYFELGKKAVADSKTR
jgi:multidrug efflux pump subunit AcrA (membrane-fusion protein)